MKLKNTTGNWREIRDGDDVFIIMNGDEFEVSDVIGAKLIQQGFMEVAWVDRGYIPFGEDEDVHLPIPIDQYTEAELKVKESITTSE